MSSPASRSPRLSGKEKRHLREKSRRMKAARNKEYALKDKLVWGCVAVGVLGAIIFVVSLAWSYFMQE